MSGKSLAKRLFHIFAILLLLGAGTGASAAGVLGNVIDSLSTYSSGNLAVHIIKFTNTIPISRTGSIEVTFPDSTQTSEPKFKLVSGQIIAAFGDVTPSTTRGGFNTIAITGDSVRCWRDGTGTDIATGSRVTLLLGLIRNPVAQRLNVKIRVNIYDGTTPFPLYDRGISAAYHIDGPAASFSLSSLGTQAAGQPFPLQVYGAKDAFGHPAGGTVAVSAASGGGAAPDGTLPALNAITLRDGSGQASQILFKAENTVALQGTSSLATRTTNSFTVSPGTANHLALTGEPLTSTAGTVFANDLTLTAFDKHNNLATNYTGTLTFANNDPAYQAGDLPGAYALSAGTGQATFPGSSFTLRTAGARRIWVSDGTLADTTGVINVTGGSIANYTLTAAGSPSAGQPAMISVTNAVDAAGNPASGTVTLAFSDGGAHSIGAYTPSLPIITVLNGAGSGTATFYKAEGPLTLRGTTGSAEKTSNSFSVQPGLLGQLLFIADPVSLNPLPATLTAGDSLGAATDSLLVVARDGFGNTKTDFTGEIVLSSSDPKAEFPLSSPYSYTFTLANAGEKKFGRDKFKLKSAGNQSFSVQSGSYSANLGSFLVKSDLITSFSLSGSATQTVGVPFVLTVSNARDQYSNPASGLVEVTAQSGGGNAPNGQTPTFTPIPVSAGGGQAAQILVKTETTRLRGRVLDGGTVLASDETDDMLVMPGALGYLELSGLPASVPAKNTFPGVVTVTAYDRYRNLKTDYSGTIRFTSSAAVATLPGDFTFTNSAQASFVDIFQIQTPGPQTITVHDLHASPVVSTTSSAIDVSAMVIKRIYSAYTQVNRGQSNIPVIMEVANYGTSPVSDVAAALSFSPNSGDFSGGGPVYYVSIDGYSAGVPGSQQITFSVSVDANATIGPSTIDGSISGTYIGSPVAVAGVLAGGTHSWNVQEQASMDIIEILPSQPAVTRGQTATWNVTVSVQNTGSYPVTIDFSSAKTTVQFRQGGTLYTDYFSVTHPTGFLSGGSTTLESGATKQMRFVVTGVSAPPGTYSIVSRVETTDGLKASDAFGSIEVQTDADLIISRIAPSQSHVTLNDATWPWYIDVSLTNQGGSTIEIDTLNSRLDFTSAGFIVGSPRLVQNNLILRGNQSDILRFPIRQSGSPAGTVSVGATIYYYIQNYGAQRAKASLVSGSVTLQEKAQNFISSIRLDPGVLTEDKLAPWRAILTLSSRANDGDILLNLEDDNTTFVKFLDYSLPLPTRLAGNGTRVLKSGTTDSLIFTGVVPVDTSGLFPVSARVGGQDVNSSLVVSAIPPQSVSLEVQNPPNLVALTNSIQPAYVSGGTVYRFQLNVMNMGGATLELDPALTVFTFTDGTTVYSSLLDAGFGTTLPGSSTRTLYFHFKDLLPAIQPGIYTPTLTLVGSENGNAFTSSQSLSNNKITVAIPREVMITSLSSETPTVTAGQAKPWYITLEIANNGSSTLHLDSTRIAFFRNSVDVSSSFALVKPDTFSSGVAEIGGTTTATVRYRVDAVDATLEPGQVIIAGRIWLTDVAQAFRRFDEQTDQGNSGVVTVQSPAEPLLLVLKPSQSKVTRGQEVPWTVSAHLRNRGGSVAAIHPDQLTLHFSAGDTLFTVQPPSAFIHSGDTLLNPGAEDSLRWTITAVDTNESLLGVLRVDGTIALTELNSDRSILLETATGNAGFDITVQDSAVATLAGLRAIVPQDSLVNGGQSFYVQACVKSLENRDSLHRTRLRLSADGYLTFPAGQEFELGPIPAGDSLWTIPGILVKADTTAGMNPTLFARILSAEAYNTHQPTLIRPALHEEDSSKTLHIQRPGVLTVKRMYTSQDTIPSGYNLDWTIALDVTNQKEGTVILDPPVPGNISIKQGFVIRAPELSEAQRTLHKGDTLHIVYEVIASSSGSGYMPITAQLTARDVNDTLRVVSANATISVYISTSARVRIARTAINAESFYVDGTGVGHLNTGQPFVVEVDVENSGGQPLKSVSVQLAAQRSTISSSIQLVENVSSYEGPRRLSFPVVADIVENLAGETFTATIIQATGEDGSTAFIAASTDAEAAIKIYRPAVLKLISTAAITPNTEKKVSYGQSFPVEVVVQNLGSEPVSGVALTMSANPVERVTLPATPLLLAKTIAAGDTSKAVFMATAGTQSGQVLIQSDITASIGQNTRLPVPLERAGQDSSTLVTVESAARLEIVSVRAPAAITAGDAQNDWRIYVKVTNTGDADLRFLDISPDNVRFYTNGILDEDYRVNAPAKLMGSDSLILRGQSQDSLLYIVTRNGDIAGNAELQVHLKAMDLNRSVSAENQMTASGSSNLEVSSTSWVRISQTSVSSAFEYDDQAVALINRGRQFKIEVEAETSELTGVDSVWVHLVADGGSSVIQSAVLIPAIGKGSSGRAEFTVVADDGWDTALGEKRESFSAQILSAKAVGSTLAAQIRQPVRPVDATTAVRIQNPARFEIRLTRESGQDSILTAGQQFKLHVDLINLGTAGMLNGQYRVTLPAGKKYQLAKGTLERAFSVPLGVKSYTDTLVLFAPTEDSFSDTVRVQLSQVPQDVNIDQAAATETTGANTVVTTLKSGMSLSLAIYSPAGAQDRILSTAQQVVLRAIVQATDNIQHKSVTLQLPVTPSYVLLTSAEQAVDKSRDTLYWRIQVPADETVLAHNFLAEARGQAADGWQTVQRSVTIDQIVGRANLWLDNLEVSSPTEGVMEGGQANFSIHQQATLRTRVRNLGTAKVGNTGKLTLSLQNSGLTFDGSDSTQSFTAGSYVTWKVKAADEVISEIRDIRAEISTTPNDENTNAAASIASGTTTLNVLTEARGVARIDQFYISTPAGALDNIVSAEQSFVVTAEITSTHVRELEAEISYTGAFSTNTPTVSVTEGTRQVVTWTMKAPAEASVNTLTLTVSARDFRSNTSLTNQVRNVTVTTQPVTRFTLTPRIILPKGLSNKVSSESAMKLALYIQHQSGTAPFVATDAATIRLNAPSQFLDGSEPLVKTGSDSLVWNLIAPVVRQDTLFDVSFSVTALPKDANSGLEAATDFKSVYFPIWVVKKARLEVLARVKAQSGVSPVSVRIGNEFDLVSILHNLGSADYYGSYAVQLRLPSGYSTKTSLTVTTESDTVSWRIKAPDRVSDIPDTLVVKLLSAPRDYFSKTPAELAADSAIVLISPEAGFMVASAFPIRSGSVGLRGGTDVPMLGLSLQNKDQSIGSQSLLDTIKVSFRNKRGSPVSARSVVSRIAAIRHGNPAVVLAENNAPGSASDAVLNFVSMGLDTIRGSDVFSLDILVDIAEAANLADFVVAIDSADAIVARDAVYLNRLSIADSTLRRVQYLGFTSGTFVVMENNLEGSFCNYPNPFGTPGRPITKFVYHLKEASDVQIKIFTLTGDLVQAWEYTKSAHPEQTSAGVHQDDVVWDGRNGRGDKVMNGIYLAYLKTEYGEMAMTKIAVVK
jgi:hypothetical protein